MFVSRVTYTDAGDYQCQINTEPKQSLDVTLAVTGTRCFVIRTHCFIHCFLDNIMKEVVPAETDDEEMFSVFNVGSFDSKVKQKQDKLFSQSSKETASNTAYSPGK